jgi:PAS domain S-box-containing protein
VTEERAQGIEAERQVRLPRRLHALSRRLGGPRILALPLLRLLAVVAGWTWVMLAPMALSQLRPLVWAMTAFTAYSGALFVSMALRPAATLRLHVPVLICDLSFALVLISLSGGAQSTLYLALLLIAGLQSYYYGLRRGVIVTATATVAYLALVWASIGEVGWADIGIRVLVLFGTALGVGVIGELEESERVEASRLRLEAAAQERFVRDVVDSLGEGVIVVDGDCRVVLVNAVVEARHGLSGREVVGRHFFSVFPEWASSGIGPEFDRLLRGTASRFLIEGMEHRTPRGDRLLLDVAGSVLRREGRPAGVVLVKQDVTERIGLEQSARRADKLAALGTLAAGLAHELNNPIGIISSRIEVMLMEGELQQLPPIVLEDLRVLHRHALRVARIARGLLAFARPGHSEEVPVDLNQVVEETLMLAEKHISRAGIKIVRALASGLPPIRGNAGTLQQVCLNLVTNAADAIAGAGEIRIETRVLAAQAGAVQLSVSDTGVGIPAEALPRIFDPFYTTKATGTGLGLSVSHGIVRDHGGTIDVHSRPGLGTTFVLTFPPAVQGVEA